MQICKLDLADDTRDELVQFISSCYQTGSPWNGYEVIYYTLDSRVLAVLIERCSN